jgi:hypothetical protein
MEHGIDQRDVASVMEGLGVTSHDAEACSLSETLYSALDADAVLVDGLTVWIRSGAVWSDYVMSDGTARRLVGGYDGSRITLTPRTVDAER